MPPKVKFSREEILRTALQLVREKGSAALTARALGAGLGSSACPVFTAFQNMEEVIGATREKAKELYGEYVRRGLAQTPAFKGVGENFILFAKEEPKLFSWLFLGQENCGDQYFMPAVDENHAQILRSVTETYDLPEPVGRKLYLHLCVYSYGIAALIVNRVCDFSKEEISNMLTDVFVGLLRTAKEGKLS